MLRISAIIAVVSLVGFAAIGISSDRPSSFLEKIHVPSRPALRHATSVAPSEAATGTARGIWRAEGAAEFCVGGPGWAVVCRRERV